MPSKNNFLQNNLGKPLSFSSPFNVEVEKHYKDRENTFHFYRDGKINPT